MSQVVIQVTGADPSRVAVVTGPNLASEIAEEQPAATVVACADSGRAVTLQRALSTKYFRPYTNADVIGAEVGGACKNVIALACGMAAGVGMGENSVAAIITRGLAEIMRLGIALGAKPATLAGLAGVGDLVATCTSPHWRYRTFGSRLGAGDSLEAAKRIAAQDPTVVEHRNTVDVHTWEGPPGLAVEYNRLHKLDPKTPENMQVHPLCMVYRGSSWELEKSQRDSLLAAHARYLENLRAQDKLGAAGTIEPPDDMQDLVIFKVIPPEEAQRLMQEDPAVKAGLLRVEYHRWWSSDHVLPW